MAQNALSSSRADPTSTPQTVREGEAKGRSGDSGSPKLEERMVVLGSPLRGWEKRLAIYDSLLNSEKRMVEAYTGPSDRETAMKEIVKAHVDPEKEMPLQSASTGLAERRVRSGRVVRWYEIMELIISAKSLLCSGRASEMSGFLKVEDGAVVDSRKFFREEMLIQSAREIISHEYMLKKESLGLMSLAERRVRSGRTVRLEELMELINSAKWLLRSSRVFKMSGILKVEDGAVVDSSKFFREEMLIQSAREIISLEEMLREESMGLMSLAEWRVRSGRTVRSEKSGLLEVEGEAVVNSSKFIIEEMLIRSACKIISLEEMLREESMGLRSGRTVLSGLLEVEGEVVVDSSKFFTETEEKEQESSGSLFSSKRSGMLEVEEEAVVGKDEEQETSGMLEIKGEALVGRDKFPAETEEGEEESAMMEVQAQAVLGGGKDSADTEEAPWIDHNYNDESVTEIEEEEESFTDYRDYWKVLMGEGSSFEDSTLLSSMLFTHCTPGCIPVDAVVGRTFQVYSVKIAEIKGHEWPLKVYGVVAARDEVDKHRNPLFFRSRDDCQILNQEDPFLHLTGPFRAIVSKEPIEIEIQLRVNGGKISDDKALITQVFYNGDYDHGLCSSVIENKLCKIELSYEQLEQSVQATIFGVHVAESSPFEHGVRVLCSSIPPGGTEDAVEPEPRQVVLFDSRYRKMSMGKRCYLNLSRQVVSVGLKGKLEVLIQAYAPSGDIAAHGIVSITPQECNTTQYTIDVGGLEVEITVAWSLLVEDKTLISMNGYVDPLAYCPPMPTTFTDKLGLPEEAPWIDHNYNDESVREIEEESFTKYRDYLKVLMGKGSSFEDSTLLSSMLYTHCTPGCIPADGVVGRTFQVYSVKIAEIKGLQWPLEVYGVVAARDEVDKHRNPLFLRSRDDCQILHQEDPFLHLTGPFRAIVSKKPIEIEIQLRVNGGKRSDDKALITQVFFRGDYDHGLCSSVIENNLCKIELSYEQLEQSVQATIFGVHVAESSPFEHGVRVLCSSLPPGGTEYAVEPEPRQVVLFDSRYRKMSMGKRCYLNLSRQVVSVGLKGKLEVLIHAYAPSGDIAAHGIVSITPQECNTTQHTIDVGGLKVEITVAWSLLVEDKTLISMNGYVDPLAYCPPMPTTFADKLGLPEE